MEAGQNVNQVFQLLQQGGIFEEKTKDEQDPLETRHDDLSPSCGYGQLRRIAGRIQHYNSVVDGNNLY